jgi:hypothetical protein
MESFRPLRLERAHGEQTPKRIRPGVTTTRGPARAGPGARRRRPRWVTRPLQDQRVGHRLHRHANHGLALHDDGADSAAALRALEHVDEDASTPNRPRRPSRGPVSGAVRVTAPFAGKRAADSWEYAEGAAEWSGLPDTVQASTRIDALTPGRFYRFRVRARTSAGMADWGDPVVFLAL